MGISKRKWISLILCFALLVGAFSTYNVKAEEKPLWILTDLSFEPSFSEQTHIYQFADHLSYSLGLDPEEIRLEYLPTEKTELSARITALRTEIMAGGGPDVFILSCNLPRGKEGVSYWESISNKDEMKNLTMQRDRLFLDPQKAMQNHILLPLDDYLESAQYFDSDLINPAVLNAGKTEEGQMILPLTITFPTAIYEKASSNRDKAEQYAYGATAWNRFPDLLESLADYSTGRLLFSKEELLQIVREALSAAPKEMPKMAEWRQTFQSKDTSGLLQIKPIHFEDLSYWKPGFYSGAYEKEEQISPVRNSKGGVTAEITSYACINQKTKRPKDAFKVLDFLFKTEVQGSTGELDPSIHCRQTFLFWNSCYGIPTRNDLLQNGILCFSWAYVGQLTGNLDFIASPETFEIYTNLRDQITTARFYGSLDEELQNMFNQCREADSDEEIEKIVSRTYETMTIMLGE